MTLVVSEISRHGIIMVGDSAITEYRNDKIVGVQEGAAKVQYSTKANVGIAMWGYGNVGVKRMDLWIAEFVGSMIDDQDDIENIGQQLAQQLNKELSATNRPWCLLRCGFHLAGYKDGLPRLWHIHCGHKDEPPHELRLYHDFPEDKGWTDEQFRNRLTYESYHLRNGYYPHFASLFDSIMNYSKTLKEFCINFPQDSLKGHLDFYKLLVQFVAGTLIAAGEHPEVNDVLSAIAFNRDGLVFNEQLPVQQEIAGLPKGLMIYFNRAIVDYSSEQLANFTK